MQRRRVSLESTTFHMHWQSDVGSWPKGRRSLMRFRADDFRRQGWAPPETLQVPDWCGCSTEYLPVPAGDGWWHLVPIWEPAQTPTPLRRWLGRTILGE